MYTEWSSLTPQITSNVNGSQQQSTLNKFNALISRDVTSALVKQLSGNLGITQKPEPSPFQTDQEVAWCMDVICFGLSLPLTDHETIKDCVNVYCEWLTCSLPSPKISVPKPIVDDPNVYTRKIINHLHNLFVPRQGEGVDVINRQTVLCHRVLRTLQNVAQSSTSLTRETWESLLLFLLAINQVLLSPPTVKDDVGDQLCERVLSVLFEVWLLACVKCFPSPSLWKTFQESCASWRHRIALVEQWNRVNLALTARLLDFTYGSSFPELKIPDEDNQLIPPGMTNDCVAQSWYRFIRMIGSPTALCCPQVISHTPQFMQYILLRDDSIEPHQHPCLLMLPQIFLKAMKGVASQVDAFLGIFQPIVWVEGIIIDNTISTNNQSNSSGALQRQSGGSGMSRSSGAEQNPSLSSSSNSNSSVGVGGRNVAGDGALMITSDHQSSPTPPLQRRLAKSFSVAPSQSHSKGLSKGSLISLTSSRSTSINTVMGPSSGPPSASSLTSILSITNENRSSLAPARPKCNSILHLFGEWLFEAAHIGSDMWLQSLKKQATEASRRPSSMIIDQKRGLSISQPSSLESEMPNGLTIDKYESGKAEAIGALCRIFCAKKTSEEILPVYLARFYMALQQGLKIHEKTKDVEETLASILFNSADLFRLDLDGVQVLLPSYIAALEMVLPEKDLKIKSHNLIFNKTELRRASIQILLSILALPLHFQSLPIRDITGGTNDKVTTFGQLKPRLINIMMSALQIETDSQNTHMLLGGLLLCVQDSATFEDVDNSSDTQSTSARDTNLLSSACSERSAYSIASGASNTSYGNSSTATMSNEPTSLMSDDLMPEDFETCAYDNAHALFVRATYLSCHRLISSWKTDLNVSLAALELLSGLARMQIKDSDALECKRAVKWICDYICYQCSRPPPSHSKDLHSTIVAAFQCTAVWLMQHPYLLQDKDSLTTVLEVVELGISGSKSIGKLGEPIKLKDEKELKPVSMRVRDAAETLLTIILEQVGYFPNACGVQSVSSLLDEVTLIKHCNTGGNLTQEQATQKFRYFVTENSTVLAILDEQLGNDQDPQPTVTLLMRTPHGRHTWTAQLRHLPRSKSGTKYHAVNPGRPIPMNDQPMRQEVEQKFFPDSVEKVAPCIADNSIPTLDAIIQKVGSETTKQLSRLLEEQLVYEKLAWAETECSPDGLGHAQESMPPNVCHEFQAARLFLSHFGFLTIGENSTQKPNEASLLSPSLIVLDSKKSGFVGDLAVLDKMSPRTCDTVHTFYVRIGQSNEQEIIDNMNEDNVGSLDANFWHMLQSLGQSVEVEDHAGWTGFINSSWRVNNSTTKKPKDFRVGDMNFNGERRIIYWADVSSEIAFVVPNRWNRQVDADSSDGSCLSTHQNDVWFERSVSEQQKIEKTPIINVNSRAQSLDYDKAQINNGKGEPVAPARRRTGANKPAINWTPSAKILLVWLESFEDHLTFPTDDLLNYTRIGEESHLNSSQRGSDCHIIFLHALNSGLLRVKLQAPQGRMNFATPLVDGMVVSKRVIGSLVKQTAYNMAKRKRLESDSYQPPHVRRRLKVQDMIQKYKLDLTEPELLTHLFMNN